MTARLILKYPDSRLRGLSEEVTFKDLVSGACKSWCSDIRDTMIANAGLGLAAPQIGIKKRIFAIDANHLDKPSLFHISQYGDTIFFINPSLKYLLEETSNSFEACLSVPGSMFVVKRSPRIKITYSSENGDTHTVQVDGDDAIVLQHELDHLDGKLFIDKLNPYDRQRFMKSHEKVKRQKSAEEIRHLQNQKRAVIRKNRKK